MSTQLQENKKSIAKIKSTGIDKAIFYPAAVLLVLALIIGFALPEQFNAGANAALNFTLDYFGWFFLIAVAIFLGFVLIVLFSPIGKIKLGGPEAEPELTVWNWFSIALCAGLAIGITFWGVAEPMYHYYGPPSITGVNPTSPESAVAALEISFVHWSFHPYAIYAIFGLAIAYSVYNLKQPFRVSSGLYPLVGERIHGLLGKSIDAVCLFAIAGGVVTSLGFGTMQLAEGLEYLLGIKQNYGIYIAIITILTVVYTISSYTGLQRGIKWLSNQNTILYIGLLLFVFLIGPSKFLLDLGVDSLGAYIQNLIPLSFWADSFNTGDGWNGSWVIFYWAWWLAFAPMVGMFLARISYGRTIRQFILVNVGAPALFGIVWFTVFGGTGIYLEHFQASGLMNTINEYGVEISTYALLENFPVAILTIPILFLTICISFVTQADSITSTMALITTKGSAEGEPPARLKIFWGLVMGCFTALFLLISGDSGTKALQTSSIVAALPIVFVEIAAMISLILAFNKKGYGTDKVDAKS